MTGLAGSYVPDMSNMAEVEKQLAAVLGKSVDELNRTECFDMEQRSEIYTILTTLKAETQTHQETIGQWVSDGSEEPCDA